MFDSHIFDLIIFNPPYLPHDDYTDRTTDGGKTGLELTIEWLELSLNLIKNTGKIIVEVDSYYFRPTDVDNLLGDPTKANKILGWKPSKSFNELVELMVENDMNVIS